ncbi:MAG: hypothetical protein HP491_03745 [Nitrospira sp.]|nr:hypothetical protein [Nitrospira sp.]MBH0180946.1 hypothetical protein [Nitrospira sp.]MBH0185562.1 hypothetical protein [Nitrospira sp.]
MTTQLDIAKVALGAFLIPWWNRGAFARALAIPVFFLVTFVLSWYYARAHLSEGVSWLFFVVYWAGFAIFAVICHRLVLLDPTAVPSQVIPGWSWRETRFILRMVGVWSICAVVALGLAMLSASIWMLWVEKLSPTQLDWIVFVVKVPVLYVFARFCIVFPATAVDRKVDLKWAWRLTANNGWRLVVLVGALPWVISQALGLLYRDEASFVEAIVLACVSSVLFAVEIAAISLSYRELTQTEGSQSIAASG